MVRRSQWWWRSTWHAQASPGLRPRRAGRYAAHVQAFFSTLDEDSVRIIASFLPLHAQVSLRRTSKQLRTVVDSRIDACWREIQSMDPTSWPVSSPIRFKPGDLVIAKVGDNDMGWMPATVVRLWYRHPEWPRAWIAPYQMRLGHNAEGTDDEALIYAPYDSAECVHAVGGKRARAYDPRRDLGYPKEKGARREWQAHGYSAMHVCCMMSGDPEALRELLRRPGPCVNNRCNRHGETPLHMAIQHRNLECVRTLLAAGADVRVPNRWGQTAWQLLRERARLTDDGAAHPDDAFLIDGLLQRSLQSHEAS